MENILRGIRFCAAGLFLTSFTLILSCSDSEASDDSTMDDDPVKATPTIFTVIGDVPYNDSQRMGLITMVEDHNSTANSEFVVHVGDIKPGAVACEEAVYDDVSNILQGLISPTFIVLGDNEFNDCDNPVQGFDYWNQYFLHFNENWNFAHKVNYQGSRTENFSWVENKVLFIGINLVGSFVHDEAEWQTRLSDNGNWVKQLMENNKNDVAAAVVFGHANIVNIGPKKFEPFSTVFRAASAEFAMPVVYIQGDGHFWIMDRPWEEKNILRVQIDGGANAVEVTVNTDLPDPFIFELDFLN